MLTTHCSAVLVSTAAARACAVVARRGRMHQPSRQQPGPRLHVEEDGGEASCRSLHQPTAIFISSCICALVTREQEGRMMDSSRKKSEAERGGTSQQTPETSYSQLITFRSTPETDDVTSTVNHDARASWICILTIPHQAPDCF
jgi:hypothetical protein